MLRFPVLRRYTPVAAGGALGAGARYLVISRYPTAPGVFPWATLSVNVSGAFLLGMALTLIAKRCPRWQGWQPFLCTGVLGAYTTFSTVSLELVTRGAGAGLAVAYALVNP
ncbi:MAG: fluoride efflux transporter FluC [Egibacteraceae bacterium]